jgi:hypothetical protein
LSNGLSGIEPPRTGPAIAGAASAEKSKAETKARRFIACLPNDWF